MSCSHPGCTSPARARSLCMRHYDQARAGRIPMPQKVSTVHGKSPEQRFHDQIRQDGDCWTWATGLTTEGYATLSVDGHQVYAHRWAYEFFIAEIPAGLVIDHLCRNRACVNPWHLEPVPLGVNSWRGDSPTFRTARLQVCQRGHDMANAYVSGKRRQCRECARARHRKYAEKARARAARGDS